MQGLSIHWHNIRCDLTLMGAGASRQTQSLENYTATTDISLAAIAVLQFRQPRMNKRPTDYLKH